MDLKLTDAEHQDMAETLHRAILNGSGTDPMSDSIVFTMDDAYRIRRKLVDLLIADGGAPKGHKIGFTSVAMQQMYGMSGPDFGVLLDTMFVAEGEPVAISGLSDTRVEPELAFVLSRDLHGPGVTVDDVLAATATVHASVEVIDSRVGAMRARAVDSIADNAGAGRVVLRTRGFDPAAVPFDKITISVTVDGEAQSAAACDVMGHPAAAVAWLANKLAEIDGLGGRIKAGDIIMSGSPTRSVAVAPGSRLEAQFGPLGALSMDFV